VILSKEQLQRDLDALLDEKQRRVADLDVQSKTERVFTLKELVEIEEQIEDDLQLLERCDGWGKGNKFSGRRY
jgi:hypothetical protein